MYTNSSIRRRYLPLALALLVAAPLANATVTLQAYDASGNQLTATQIRSTMKAQGWDYTDTLVNQTSLQVLKSAPLYNVTGGVAFDPVSQPSALAVNWPTTRGYSLLIIDNGGAGFSGSTNITVNLTYRAALDVKRRLDAAVTARPNYVMSPGFIDAYERAKSHLATATSTTSEATRGKEGQLALDQLAKAQDLMLAEYGIAYTQQNLASRPPQIGLTIDTTASYAANLDRAKQIGGAHTWVRIVFDAGMAPGDYTTIINAAKARGIKVLAEPIDSYEASRYTREGYLARFKQFVDALPQVDAWEAGNEVNGSWLGSGMDLKIADTAAYIRSTRPNALVYVTLYWQIGTDYGQWSTFNWARANLPATTRANIDVIALSAYVEDAPMGLAMDQVFNALSAEFPQQKIMFGELDYWLPDTSRAWWAFNQADPTGAGRQGVAAQYYAAALGYSFSLGGGYWWNFAGYRATNDPSLDTIAAVASQATTPQASTPPPPTATCVRATPVTSLSGPTTAVAAGTTVTYTLSVGNKDSSTCDNTSFNLARTVPVGWTGTLSASSVNLAPGASATSILNVTSANDSTAGSYGIGAGVASSVGSIHTASASATYTTKDVALAPLTESVATDKTSYGLGQTVYISARVLSNGTPVSGATVAVSVFRPNGSVNRLTAISDGNGIARVTHSIGTGNRQIGSYSLKAVATKDSMSVTATAAFTVAR